MRFRSRLSGDLLNKRDFSAPRRRTSPEIEHIRGRLQEWDTLTPQDRQRLVAMLAAKIEERAHGLAPEPEAAGGREPAERSAHLPPGSYSSRTPLMTSSKSQPRKLAARRQRTMRVRKISK